LSYGYFQRRGVKLGVRWRSSFSDLRLLERKPESNIESET
jgi:hypothetical protein